MIITLIFLIMLQLFEFSGNKGSLEFFKSGLFRVFVVFILFAVLSIVETIFALSGFLLEALPTTPPPSAFNFTWEKFVEMNTAPGVYTESLKSNLISLVIFGQLDLRRANDLSMSYV